MKKLICTALCLLLCACSANEVTEYDLEKSMQEMSKYIEQSGRIIDVDVEVLNDFLENFASMGDGATIKVRGLVSDFQTKPNILGAITTDAKIMVGDLAVHVIFEEGQQASNGEYIEVAGTVLTTSHTYSNGASFTLSNGHITERGASVRERIEK